MVQNIAHTHIGVSLTYINLGENQESHVRVYYTILHKLVEVLVVHALDNILANFI